MRRSFILTFALATLLPAQQTVAPTSESVGSARGTDWSNYNIFQSFEFGYRFSSVGGDLGMYRSTVNYRDGLRLLGSRLTVNSKDGHGHFFDTLTLTTQGLGNDPYQLASLRIEKNRLYRYDLSWRLNEYYNPALPIAFGEHLMTTSRRMQDHDLTLLPDSKIRFFLGYSRNAETGPALSTIQLFDHSGDEFPLFQNIRRLDNQYRLGAEARVLGFKLNVMHIWDDFKEDTPTSLTSPSPGNNPNDRTTLTSLQRSEPYHGTSPFWRVALFREGKSWYAVNGRFTYTAGRRAFVQDESALGTSRFGLPNTRQVLTFGDAQRPEATGNLTLSLFPTSRLTLSNQTSVYSIRMVGNSYYQEVNNATLSSQFFNFQYLGIRLIANSTDFNYRFTPAIAVFGGYTYSNRLVRSNEQSQVGASIFPFPGQKENTQHTGAFGIRLKPAKPLTIILDGEIGRAGNPFYPISDRNYQVLGASVQYKMKALLLSAAARSNYNVNSVTVSTFSSHSRNYSFDGSWVPWTWFSIDAGYSKLHLDTVGGIAYFLTSQLTTGEQSYYISNIHAANLGTRFAISSHADLYLGYSRVQDAGDGRSNPFGPGFGSTLPAFQAAQTFPLAYESPLARVSVKLREKLRWNIGYQHYRYLQQFSALQNYRAHTGYSSLLWSF